MGSPSDHLVSQAADCIPLQRQALDTPPSSDVEVEELGLPPSPPASPQYAQAKLTKGQRATRTRLDRILGILHVRHAGRCINGGDEAWQLFKLDTDEYAALCRRIQLEGLSGWYDDRCRYHYDGAHYSLHMPTELHEFFIAGIEDTLLSAICELASQIQDTLPSAAAALRSIHKGRSPTLSFHPPQLENSRPEAVETEKERVLVQRCPDGTLYYRSPTVAIGATSIADSNRPARYPPFVLEVSYSQTRKSLPRLAESYIIDSAHRIRCVLGIDVAYQAPRHTNTTAGSTNCTNEEVSKADKSARLSLWRPGVENSNDNDENGSVGICENVLDAVPFRNAIGMMCEGELQLALSDLLPADIFSGLALAAPTLTQSHISIPFSKLATLLDDAEANSNTLTPYDIVTESTPYTPRNFRKRKRTPSESLSDRREEAFVRLEEADRAREDAVDETWSTRVGAVGKGQYRA